MNADADTLPPQRATLYVVILAILIGLSLMDRQLLSVVAASTGEAFFRTVTLAPAAATLQRLAPDTVRVQLQPQASPEY